MFYCLFSTNFYDFINIACVQEYWKVKNSWGSTWSEEVYVLICRKCNANGRAGECGILENQVIQFLK